MDRLLAFILGGVALALYAPKLFLGAETLVKYHKWWFDFLGQGWYDKVFSVGPGVFAGLALLLLAIRGGRN